MPAPGEVLDTVLVGGEYRVVGAVTDHDMEELERMADAGDELRAEARLELLRKGRPGERARLLQVPASPPPGFWHNCKHPCGAEGCNGWPALRWPEL